MDQGSTAKLECQADANPVVTDMIRWQREGYEMMDGKVEQTFEEEKSYLTVYNVTKADSGSFKCIAQNGIGTANIKVADLVVKCKSFLRLFVFDTFSFFTFLLFFFTFFHILFILKKYQ